MSHPLAFIQHLFYFNKKLHIFKYMILTKLLQICNISAYLQHTNAYIICSIITKILNKKMIYNYKNTVLDLLLSLYIRQKTTYNSYFL